MGQQGGERGIDRRRDQPEQRNEAARVLSISRKRLPTSSPISSKKNASIPFWIMPVNGSSTFLPCSPVSTFDQQAAEQQQLRTIGEGPRAGCSSSTRPLRIVPGCVPVCGRD